jgi:hypothetical protein
MRVLRNAQSSGDGGGHAVNVPEPTDNQSHAATPPAVPAAQTPGPAAPPASETVVHGDRTEENIQLRESLKAKDAEIEELKRQLKDREISVCEYQDKVHALQTPQPVPVRTAKAPREFRLGRFV